MNASTSSASDHRTTADVGNPITPARVRHLPRAARTVLNLLARLPHGPLSLVGPSGETWLLGKAPADAPALATLVVNDWAVCARVMQSGDIGLAEAYLDGQWDSPDLPALMRLFMHNRDAMEQVIYGSRWGSWLYRIKHLLHRNTRRGSRKNIHAHYDLGNAFYRLWLDPTMNYSSAWFDGDHHQTLAHGQVAKMQRALNEAQVNAGDRVLEIGCGWGAIAEWATSRSGVHLTGVTLSTEQLDYARARIDALGRTSACDLRLMDYRDLVSSPGFKPFDAVVSIEMFEAVGREYWPSYFNTLAACLKPGARACIQTITIRDDLFERYARSTDFIQQYIFPGGLLPSDSVFRAECARAGLVVERALAFGPDYAETLRRWRRDFEASLPTVRGLGFDPRFESLWRFYLVYCEAAFDTGNTQVVQYTLRRP